MKTSVKDQVANLAIYAIALFFMASVVIRRR